MDSNINPRNGKGYFCFFSTFFFLSRKRVWAGLKCLGLRPMRTYYNCSFFLRSLFFFFGFAMVMQLFCLSVVWLILVWCFFFFFLVSSTLFPFCARLFYDFVCVFLHALGVMVYAASQDKGHFCLSFLSSSRYLWSFSSVLYTFHYYTDLWLMLIHKHSSLSASL